jgi:signal transduction histidine kinase
VQRISSWPFDELELLTIIKSRIEKHNRIKEKIELERLNYIKELEDLLHIISHRVRSPLCSNLGLMELLNIINGTIDNTNLKKIIEGIKINTLRLDDFTRELSMIMHKSVLKHKDKIEKR